MKSFDFTIDRATKPIYLAELILITIEDIDDVKISDNAKKEIVRILQEVFK